MCLLSSLCCRLSLGCCRFFLQTSLPWPATLTLAASCFLDVKELFPQNKMFSLSLSSCFINFLTATFFVSQILWHFFNKYHVIAIYVFFNFAQFFLTSLFTLFLLNLPIFIIGTRIITFFSLSLFLSLRFFKLSKNFLFIFYFSLLFLFYLLFFPLLALLFIYYFFLLFFYFFSSSFFILSSSNPLKTFLMVFLMFSFSYVNFFYCFQLFPFKFYL